jgi:Trk K+ transport system NAD-binding subunit
MFIVRPLNIFASVHEKNISFKEKLFLSWIAPRGIIAAAVAILFAFTLEQHGFKEASQLASLTFMTIAITVVLQGLTAKPLAKILGVLQTGTSGIVILGGNNLGVAIARELSNKGIAVIIIDSNRLNCLTAEREGISAFCGNVLNDQIWDDMDLTNYGSFLAATSNNELNSLAALRAAQIFSKNKIYQIRNTYKNEKHPFTLDMIAGNQNYDLSLDVMGTSSNLQYGNSIIESVKPEWLNKEQTEKSIILFGIEKGKVLFSTDMKKLSSAGNIIRIYHT